MAKVSPLDELESKVTLGHHRLVASVICVLLAGFLVWANIAELEEVAIAQGEVIPQGQVKVIQHLEGGIIQGIFVREGDIVHPNDPLVQLDQVSQQNNKHELEVNLDGLLVQRARLEAEAYNKELVFPKAIAARRPKLVDRERRTHEGRARELQSTLSVLREQVRQRESELQQLHEEKKAAIDNLALARQEFAISSNLIVDGLTSKVDHLRIEREVTELEGRLQSMGPALTRNEAALAEARERMREGTLSFRREALEQLSQNERDVARIRETLARATDQARRTEIVSPIEGVVKKMTHNTIGGVVRPGEAIMEIVPTSANLVVEAKLNPRDVGYVHVGQDAMVKLSTYDFSRYGGLKGKVNYLSADSYTTPEGQTYFLVQAQTDKTYLGPRPGDLPITPGMQATIDIHTGRKKVIQYMLKPVLRLRWEAFHER